MEGIYDDFSEIIPDMSLYDQEIATKHLIPNPGSDANVWYNEEEFLLTSMRHYY